MTASAVRLSDEELLSAWEEAAPSPPAVRALAVVARTVPPGDRDEVEEWTVGRRDARLLDLHEAMFGGEVSAVTSCPDCSESLELEFPVADVRTGYGGGESFDFAHEDTRHRVVVRLPTSGDLVEAATCDDTAGARAALLARCVVTAEREGEAVAPADLPDAVVAAVGLRMAELDPQAELTLSLDCAACGHAWQPTFDIADFVWRKLDLSARELLAEIAALAAAFAWSEQDILRLSPARRRLYLGLVDRD